jgi:hypothetical protein
MTGTVIGGVPPERVGQRGPGLDRLTGVLHSMQDYTLVRTLVKPPLPASKALSPTAWAWPTLTGFHGPTPRRHTRWGKQIGTRRHTARSGIPLDVLGATACGLKANRGRVPPSRRARGAAWSRCSSGRSPWLLETWRLPCPRSLRAGGPVWDAASGWWSSSLEASPLHSRIGDVDGTSKSESGWGRPHAEDSVCRPRGSTSCVIGARRWSRRRCGASRGVARWGAFVLAGFAAFAQVRAFDAATEEGGALATISRYSLLRPL